MSKQEFSEADLYVSPHGDDFWSGTLAAPNADKTDGPFETIQGAKRALKKRKGHVYHRQVHRYHAGMRKPFTIWIRGGRYHIESPILFDSDDSAPVTFAAYPGETPVIDGSRRIENWKKGTINGVSAWIADIPKVAAGVWNFRELYVNDERRNRPRFPREGLLQMEGVAGIPSEKRWESDDTQFIARDGDFRNFANLSEVEVVYLHRWIDERSTVESYDTTTRIVALRRPSVAPIEGRGEIRPADYYLDNVFEELAEPGQWYLDRTAGRLYYIPREGETIENTAVYAPVALQLLALKGDSDRERYVEFLRFEGLTFQNTDWRHPDASDDAEFIAPTGYHEVFQDFDYRRGNRAGCLQAACDVPGVVSMEAARHCQFIDCTVRNVGWYGFEIADGCRGIGINHCTVNTAGAGGIKINGASARGESHRQTGDHSITDNELSALGRIFHSAVGVLSMHCRNTEISHNHIHDLYYTAISCGWDWGYMDTVSRNNRIAYNNIHDIGQGLLSDMGGIYLLGVQPGTVVEGNLIHDITKAHYGGWCIYPDEGSSHMLIQNNVCYKTNDSLFNQHYGRENLVRNNVFAFGGESVLSHGRSDDGQISIRFERNMLITDGKPIFRGGYGCLISDKNHTSDLNLMWDSTGADLTFVDRDPLSSIDFAAWQAYGHDRHSIVADPMCADPENGGFSLAEDSPAFALGFEAIDLSSVGPRER